MVQRRIPKYKDLRPLMNFKTPEFNAKKRRLQGALTIADLRDIAQRRTPKAAFDYTEGAAEAEISLKRARQAFEDIEFTPSILRDVSTVDMSSEVLGGRVALPFGIAPTGFTRMMQTEGEIELCIGQVQAGRLLTASEVGAQHQGILDAVTAGDADLAARLTREHITGSRDRLLAHFDTTFPE